MTERQFKILYNKVIKTSCKKKTINPGTQWEKQVSEFNHEIIPDILKFGVFKTFELESGYHCCLIKPKNIEDFSLKLDAFNLSLNIEKMEAYYVGGTIRIKVSNMKKVYFNFLNYLITNKAHEDEDYIINLQKILIVNL
jgi:hypothetical protein